MIEYPTLSDMELLDRSRNGDELAENTLILRYRRIVRSCTRPFFLAGGDSEDLLQEGMIGLLCAMREYDPAGYRVCRGELYARQRDPALTIRYNNASFNMSAISLILPFCIFFSAIFLSI